MKTKYVIISRDLTFHEKCFPYRLHGDNYIPIRDLFIPRDTKNTEPTSSINDELPVSHEKSDLPGATQTKSIIDKTIVKTNDQPNLSLGRPVRMKVQPSYLKDYKCNASTNTNWCNLIQYHALSSLHKKIVQNHKEYTN